MSGKAAVLAAPLPRMAGGTGLARLSPAAGLHSNLTVGPVNDEYEREADRSAEYVMSLRGLGGAAIPPVLPPHPGASGVQRTCACGGKPEGEGECEECAKARLQRKASDGAGNVAAPASVHQVLRSPGRPLDPPTRAFMEPRFGHDFSQVRIHTDEAAAASARDVHALAYTTGAHVVFGEGQYRPGTDVGRRLLAHELTHVIQQSSGLAPRAQPAVMRAGACEHDKKGTGCGPGGGTIKFPSETMHLDQEVVNRGLKQFGGHWLTEVLCPPNPEKSNEGKTGGRIDGLRVSETGGLKVEVAEVKPRSPGSLQSTQITGGCAQASREARGYVAAVQRIAPRVRVLSEKFSKIGGYRLDHHHAPKGKEERGIFKTVGVNIDDDDWFQAWRFYNSLQNKIPKVFTSPFSSVDVSLFTQGSANTSYDAIGWRYHCDKGTEGVEKLVYMVNNDGGVSYGCERSCGDEKKEAPKEKKPVADPPELTARLKDILSKKDALAAALALQEGALEAQRSLIYKPSVIGFVGYWVNVLYNKEPPTGDIWIQVHALLIRVENALKAKNVQAATAALMRARRAYVIAVKKFTTWEAGLPGAAAKMERAIKAVAAAAILAFVAPSLLRPPPPGATQTLFRIAEVMQKADTAIAAAETAGQDLELILQAEEEVQQLLEAGRLVTWL